MGRSRRGQVKSDQERWSRRGADTSRLGGSFEVRSSQIRLIQVRSDQVSLSRRWAPSSGERASRLDLVGVIRGHGKVTRCKRILLFIEHDLKVLNFILVTWGTF